MELYVLKLISFMLYVNPNLEATALKKQLKYKIDDMLRNNIYYNYQPKPTQAYHMVTYLTFLSFRAISQLDKLIVTSTFMA